MSGTDPVDDGLGVFLQPAVPVQAVRRTSIFWWVLGILGYGVVFGVACSIALTVDIVSQDGIYASSLSQELMFPVGKIAYAAAGYCAIWVDVLLRSDSLGRLASDSVGFLFAFPVGVTQGVAITAIIGGVRKLAALRR
ncbi:MAG: hypothetical protein WDM88_00765 [Galbitalea sp.]